MSKGYAPGRKVLIVADPKICTKWTHKFIGQEATIVKYSHTDPKWGTMWRLDNGCIAAECVLKLIDDDEEKGSWEAVEEITGWSPVKEVAC